MCNELCLCTYGRAGQTGNRCAMVFTHRVVQGRGKSQPALRRAAWGWSCSLSTPPQIRAASAVLPALGDRLFLWQGPCGQRGSPPTLSPSGSVSPPLASASGLRAGTPAKAQLRSKISIDKPGPALVVGEIFIPICSAFSILYRCSALMRASWIFFFSILPPRIKC